VVDGLSIQSKISKEKSCFTLEVKSFKNLIEVSIFKSALMSFNIADCLSNDPPSKENPYKSFYTQIGSARPIRGKNNRTPIVKVDLQWNKLQTETVR